MGVFGIDIGTCNLVCATKDVSNPNSEASISSIRDAFLSIEDVDSSTLNMLKMSNTSYVKEGDTVYILGENALNMANLFRREVSRPMASGIIAPGELLAEKILLLLLRSIIKQENNSEGGIAYYSIPAKPIDSNLDVLYHEAMFKKIIESLGLRAVSINEAVAIVYANSSASEGFTALCSSFGAGLINNALVYQTIVGMSFSTSKAGDYVNEGAGKSIGGTASKLMSIKERGINLLDPSDGDPKYIREREALCVYYKNMINNVIVSIKNEFKKDTNRIELPSSIPWILSGGSVLAKNFLEFFKSEFAKVKDFPLSISSIRLANSPLDDTAKGCLIAAMND